MPGLPNMWKRFLSIAHRAGFTRNEAGVIVFLAAALLAGGAITTLRGDGAQTRPEARRALAAQDSVFAAKSMSPAAPQSAGAEAAESDAAEAASSTGNSRNAPSIVNINQANGEMLETLPGIGPSTARKIIDYRNGNGSFERIEDLMQVKGIGPKKFEKIRLFITVR